MCGYAFGADFLFTWPNAMTGVMGGEQAALTMEQVARRTAERKGVEADEARLAAQRAKITAHFGGQSDAFYTSGRVLDMMSSSVRRNGLAKAVPFSRRCGSH